MAHCFRDALNFFANRTEPLLACGGIARPRGRFERGCRFSEGRATDHARLAQELVRRKREGGEIASLARRSQLRVRVIQCRDETLDLPIKAFG